MTSLYCADKNEGDGMKKGELKMNALLFYCIPLCQFKHKFLRHVQSLRPLKLDEN